MIWEIFDFESFVRKDLNLRRFRRNIVAFRLVLEEFEDLVMDKSSFRDFSRPYNLVNLIADFRERND